MFGANNKPFGSTTAFGAGSFGTSTPFGQGSTAFGAKPATNNVFGTSTFGVSTPNTGGGLFGAASQPTGSGLFGQPSSTFGTPASTSTNTFGGFGTTSSSGGLFGTAASSTPSTGGLFGGSTSAFGAPRPTFGGFGTTNTGTGLFGQNPSTGTSLFGSTGFTASTPTGTTIKFNPPTGTDTMMKGGVSTSISTRHQCITCMKEYENKSLEELRVEDYAANRKGGSAGGITFGGATQTGGLFGSTPAASTSGFSFGTTQSKPLFGTTGTTNAFGSSNSIFGQPAQTQNTGLFGKSVAFGATTTAAPPVFNFGGTSTMGTGTSLFGQNNQQKPLFGQPTSTTGGLFGSTATTQSTGFGTTGGFGAFGATNQPSTGLFGAKPSTGFGTANTTTTNSFSFGNTNNMSGGLFGQKPAAPAFGANTGFGTQSSGFGSFGTTSTLGGGTGLFGQNKPATSVFGNTGSTFGTGLGSTFGSSSFPSIGGLGSNTSTGLFGNTSANKSTGFNFGGTGSTGFNFGSNTSGSAFNFNPSSSLVGGSDANNAAALQQVQQQILAMTANPFGDSPLFRNPLKDTSRESEVLKPTNPSAQKALLNDNQFKVALLPTAKIKPKPWSPSPSGKTYLFDGLEDEEPGLGTAAFLPKKSVKKLVLKNLGSNHSTLTVTSDISGASNQSTRIDVSISLNKSNKSSEGNASLNCVPLTSNISDNSITNLHNDSGVALSAPAKVLSISRSPSDESVPGTAIGHNSMDDSIAALHTNKYGIRRSYNVSSDSEGAGDNEDLPRKSSAEGEIIQDSTDTVGVILKRPNYYTIPPLNELKSYLDENGDCFIEDFTIGREGYGNVVFPGRINVAGLNLDEIVHFERKEIDVYPEHVSGIKKPPVGEGLNREAIVTLYEVWPMDKTTHTPIQDPERLEKMGYAEKIKKSTSKLGARFINYIPESGSWIFKVAHFSKYGLIEDDSDEEMDVTKPHETDKTKAPPKVGEFNGQVPPPLSMQPKQILKRKPISTVAVEDDDMSDVPFPMANQQEFLFPEGNDFAADVFSPTRPLFSNIDAERIQGMKASFFQQEMDDDNWGVDPFQTLCGDSFGLKKDFELKASTTKFGSSKLNGSANSLNKKQRYLENHNDQSFMSHMPTKLADTGMQSSMSSLSLIDKQNEWLSSFPLVKSIPQKPLVTENQVHILNKIRLKPLEKSFMSNKLHLLADAGYFMGRSFRPGWRFDGLLVTVQPPLESDYYSESLPKFFLYGDNVSFSYKSNKRSGFTLALNEVKISTYYENKDQIQKNLVETLQLQLQNSVSTLEGDVPLFVPKPGVELIHAHAKLFEDHLKNSDLDSDPSFAKQCVDVWNLLVSLWGKVRGIDEEEDLSNYALQMARREAVSSWLIKSSENSVAKAITNLSQDNYLGKIFLYLTSLRISDAVKLAQQHQDYRMSLLLSQAEGTAIVRKWLCNQLLMWEQNGAYKFIKNERIVLYALLAGLLLWENVYETVNCCKNLDWKQALALHLWYHCEPNASIQIAVAEYDKAFQGVNSEKYSLPPYPPYIDPFSMDQEMQDNSNENENVYDTCYHLLKLYCDRSYRLDKLLMPETYTTDHLDYRLSWLLHLALSSIGFNIPVDLSCTLHSNFASELESIGMWHWAIFISLHHPDSQWRMKVVKDILLRHVSLDLNDKNEENEKFLKDHLLLPEKWIFEAKAIKAHSMGKHAEEAWFLLKAGSWNKSHSIVIKYLASDAIINEDFEYLKKYLCEMSLPERNSTISDWANGGQVYLDYINMNEMVKGILGREISAYELEKVTPEVLSLCNRLSSIPTPTIKDRVCVAEMAKKTATIMRSIAMLQVECSKNKTSLISLASYFKNLPMPHDYAVSENRFIVHEFL